MLPLSKWDKLPFSSPIMGRSPFKRRIYLFEIYYIKFENTVIKICFHIKEAIFVKCSMACTKQIPQVIPSLEIIINLYSNCHLKTFEGRQKFISDLSYK